MTRLNVKLILPSISHKIITPLETSNQVNQKKIFLSLKNTSPALNKQSSELQLISLYLYDPMNTNKITSIAAALVAKAGTNASAGIGALASEDSSGIDNARRRVTNCMHNVHSSNSTLERSLKPTSVGDHKHQIGTNLSDLSVCWHKPTWPEQCSKCGEPYYTANQYSCENCKNDGSPIAGTLRSDFYDQYQDIGTNDMYNSSTLLSIIENNNNNMQIMADKEMSQSVENTLSDQLPMLEYLTRKNFEEEFSSLIMNSTHSSANFVTSFTSDKKLKSIQPINSTLTKRDLIEQIKLYNKYNNSKLTELKYESNEELLVTGLLKIHWNLKQPIQLSTALSTDESNDDSLKSEQQTNFKATLLKDLSLKKKTSYDDSSLNKKNKINSSLRAQTVFCKPNKFKRPGLNISEAKESESQNFIPAYASVSSIRIDSQVTCLKAIQILLDKYHISNPASKYSLYKCYQSGETRELDDDSFPLIERIWMGPFSEDKLFIMEKGHQIHNQEVSNLMCLPESLLQNLLDNLAKEEQKEIETIRSQFFKYQEILKTALVDFEKTEVTQLAEEITTSCRM